MTTFNVDSLDFSDGEAIRTGADDDFSTRYSSSNDRLEIEDLTNATVGHIPRDTGTDLVGGKFAETLSEGEALADNGEVYESIQEAVNNASSFVRVGPGEFRESVTIDTAGLTLQGSGERTRISQPESSPIRYSSDNVTISSLTVSQDKNTSPDFVPVCDLVDGASNVLIRGVLFDNPIDSVQVGPEGTIINSTVIGSSGNSIVLDSKARALNCFVRDCRNSGITDIGGNTISAHNVIKNCGNGILVNDVGDHIIHANRIMDSRNRGIHIINEPDVIVSNNRISNSGREGIDNNGSGTVLDGNLTT